MRLNVIHAAVTGALLLGGTAALAQQQYYVIQPVANDRVVVEERAVQPAPAVVVPRERVVTRPGVVVPGERMTVTYNVDDPYPFPSPESRITQSGVFVPDQPAMVDTAPSRTPPSWSTRSFNTDPPFNTD